jgi:hypothetical protein
LMSRNSKFETFLPLFLLTSSVECVQNPWTFVEISP